MRIGEGAFHTLGCTAVEFRTHVLNLRSRAATRSPTPTAPADCVGESDTRRRRIVALMIAVMLVIIVGTTVHLPATPAMADNLGGDIATVQGFPTAYLIASASGQLVLGPLSDAVGRRRLLLPDLGGFAGGPAREGGAVPGVAVPTVWPYRLEIRPGAPPPTAPVRAGRRGSARRRSRDSCPS